ncbi:MAG: M15 family metallopeptidase [Clostridia bacterium]|nr:M15 family metallopeptidase [Clostridia bacterium]
MSPSKTSSPPAPSSSPPAPSSSPEAPNTTTLKHDKASFSSALPASNQADKHASPKGSDTDTDEKPSKSLLPKGFVYVKEALPDAKLDIRYATKHNFTGKTVDGYLSSNTCMTVEAAEALKKASLALKEKGYGILIYDAYRPKRAVKAFVKWGKSPEDNLTNKEFYPGIPKADLFKLGYIAKKSAHSRGSAVDLTLYDLKTGKPLDMGSSFDFLNSISNHGTNRISEKQTQNRNVLKTVMKANGFKELKTEWWHYQLVNEPFRDTYFDFVIQ